GRSVAFLLIPIVLVVVGIVVAHRRSESATVRYLALVAALAVAGCFALSRVEGEMLPYLFLWRPVIAIAVVLGVGWALLSGVRTVQRYGTVVGLVLAALVVAVSSGQYAGEVARASSKDTGPERATASLARQLERHGIPDDGVILRLEETSFAQLQRGIFDELARDHDEVFVDERLAYQYRHDRAAAPRSVGRVWWVAENGAALTELMEQPGARLIASWSPIPPRLDRRARHLSTQLRSQFHALDRSDLDAQLDAPLLALVTSDLHGINHAAARELAAINDQLSRRGGQRVGVVSFSPDDAPEQLSVS
ncbi:MAG TPA: hypothetical protein VK549_10970, partial [Acidimicrobiia bacterium]|nr:hypothetical protein [Acidimicrobiia bacterium]